jgi:hypothetical protein
MKNIIIIFIVCIILGVTIIYLRKMNKPYSYIYEFNESSFKVTKKGLNIVRGINCFIDFSGDKRNFLDNYDMNQKLKDWFINNTHDQHIISEIAIGIDGDIQKIYYTKDEFIYGYKINEKTGSEEKCVYIPEINREDIYLKFISKLQFDKIKKIIPILEDKTVLLNYTVLNGETQYLKGLHVTMPIDGVIKLNDPHIKQMIRILGFETPELTQFLDDNSDKIVSFVSFGENNNYLSIYYLDKENLKQKRRLKQSIVIN